ncbi:MAG: metallophosphoesterase [Verrucomicrobiae bacterium]|nr:metallophosphoesterase [Verrucomicrobiae bacterium]
MKDATRGFVLFLSIFLSAYGLAHLYVWWRLIKPLNLKGAVLRVARVCFAVLFLVFPLTHFWLRYHHGFLWPAYWLGAIWTGVVVYLAVVGLGAEIMRAVLLRRLYVVAGECVAVAIIAAAVTVYGMIEARRIRVSELRIELPGLGDRVRVAHVCDVHAGWIVRGAWLEQIVERINNLQPDLIVLTGDLVDAGALRLEELISSLRRLRAPLGVFAVAGNHEFFVGIEKVEKLLQQADIVLLRNRSVVLNCGLQLVGLDDPIGYRLYGQPQPPPVEKLIRRGLPTVLLLHTPVTKPERLEAAGVHLQLSGHTHRGQLWPVNLIVKCVYKRPPYGLFSNGRVTIYVNGGVGTWGPPMRVGAPPEIALVTLEPKRR